MNTNDIMQFIFSGVILIMSCIIIPLVKRRLTDEQADYVQKWVCFAVCAYEQIFNESGMGQTKKRAVHNFLKNKGIMLKDDELNVLIEKTVFELNK